MTLGVTGKVQGGGGPSLASVVGTAVGGGPATTGLPYLAVAAVAVLGAVAILPKRR